MSTATRPRFVPSDIYCGMHQAWRVKHYRHAKWFADGLFELAGTMGPRILTTKQWAITREIQAQASKLVTEGKTDDL
jgi:hypothetical protein